MTSTNSQRNRHQSTVRKSKDQLFAFYDAQPAATRKLFQDFPENLWPNSYSDHFHGFAEAHKRYLANLKNVWGVDHPAVIDATRRVSTRRNKIVDLANADDLLADF